MTPEQFIYWLQGYFELTDKALGKGQHILTESQVQEIQEHLRKVFNREEMLGLKYVKLDDSIDLPNMSDEFSITFIHERSC